MLSMSDKGQEKLCSDGNDEFVKHNTRTVISLQSTNISNDAKVLSMTTMASRNSYYLVFNQKPANLLTLYAIWGLKILFDW